MRTCASLTVLPALVLAFTALSTPCLAQLKPGATPAVGWTAYSGRGHLGLSSGRSRYDRPCGIDPLFPCERGDGAASTYAGSMFDNHWGLEAGYLNLGRIQRGGGVARASGLNLSLVGRLPVAQAVGLYGRMGTTYGRTEASATLSSALPAGRDAGFGLSYGAGLSFDLSSNLSATLGWDSHDFRSAGPGRDAIRATSLGLSYRY